MKKYLEMVMASKIRRFNDAKASYDWILETMKREVGTDSYHLNAGNWASRLSYEKGRIEELEQMIHELENLIEECEK